MDSAPQLFHEPLRTTLTRTVGIALSGGAVLAFLGVFRHWPVGVLMVLWPSFGGHWVEVFFLNVVQPRLPAHRVVQSAVRILVWFVGGIALAFGMHLSAMAFGEVRFEHWPVWWMGGLGFIGIELIVHALRSDSWRQ